MTAPRIVTLSPEALNTCNHWQTITSPNEITDVLFTSTRAMLADFSIQEDQTTTITNLQEATIAAQNATITALTASVTAVQ